MVNHRGRRVVLRVIGWGSPLKTVGCIDQTTLSSLTIYRVDHELRSRVGVISRGKPYQRRRQGLILRGKRERRRNLRTQRLRPVCRIYDIDTKKEINGSIQTLTNFCVCMSLASTSTTKLVRLR